MKALLCRSMKRSVLAISCLLLAGTALAEGPPLTYQGRLLADGAPVANGEYTLTIELFNNAEATSRICGDTQVTVPVIGGYFAHRLQDTACATGLRQPRKQVYVRVLARGGPFGDRDVELGIQPVSTGIFALHAEGGGGSVGDIVPSMLTLQQFQAQRGEGWVLADGSSYPNSHYAQITSRTSVPDLRGVFLRGRDHGRMNSDGQGNPAGNLDLGTFQADQVGDHEHLVVIPGVSADAEAEQGLAYSEQPMSEEEDTEVGTVSETQRDETRPKNVTVNYFIRID